jgi:hypothetical protein
MFEFAAVAISLGTNGLLIWSGFRAWRLKNRFLKWSGAGLAAPLSLRRASFRSARSGPDARLPGARPREVIRAKDRPLCADAKVGAPRGGCSNREAHTLR